MDEGDGVLVFTVRRFAWGDAVVWVGANSTLIAVAQAAGDDTHD